MSRQPLLVALVPLVALALAGCLGGSNPVPQSLDIPGIPALPLVFGKEVAIDKDHRGPEPSIVVDSKNHYFVSAPSGMVSTVFNSVADPSLLPAQGPTNRQSFIWKSEDEGATWKLLSITMPPLPPLRGDATFGGADTDLAVDSCDTVYFTDLWLGNIAVSHSDDGGATWVGTPITGILPVLDRQWLAAGKECGEVFLLYQTFYGQVWALKSTDKGMTWPQQTLVLDCGLVAEGTPPLPAAVDGCYSFDGNIIFDKASGKVYAVLGSADNKGLQILSSKDDGMTWKRDGEVKLPGAIFLIPAIASDAAGNVYAVAAANLVDDAANKGKGLNIYLTRSLDQGASWSEAIVVSGPADQGVELFPWVAAGDAGKVVIAWVGSNETVEKPDDVKGDWFVSSAVSTDAASAIPTWTVARVSERPNHKGEICTLGLTCTLPQPLGTRGNRNLADFMEVAIDMKGRIVAAWPDDYDVAEQFISLPYFGKQIEGPVLLTATDATSG